MHRPSQRVVVRILNIKKQLGQVRRRLTPLREAMGSLESSSHPLIKGVNRPYLRDVRGKIQALYERSDSQRSLLDSLENLYLSSVGQRTNEVVVWGYPMVLILMALVAASMVLWMRQKKFW